MPFEQAAITAAMPIDRFAALLPCLVGLALSACGSSERDTIADRVEPEISPAHATDPGERRVVAESLADDAISLRNEAREAAVAEAAAGRAIEERLGTPENAMARECEQLRLELAALQRPSTETRTPEETAEVPAAIEKLKARIGGNC